MQTTPATHVAGGFAGNRDLVSYMKYKYVPIELGRFSNTLEYSYDDWTVGQMAKALGKFSEYATFNDRGYWWKMLLIRKMDMLTCVIRSVTLSLILMHFKPDVITTM